MAMSLNETIRNARLALIRDAIDAGSGPGLLRIYDGTRPASGAAITTETLLAELAFADPCASAPSAGVLTFSTIAAVNAAASGTAAWARLLDSDATFVADVDVSAVGGGGQLTLSTTSISAGLEVEIESGSITDGNA